MCASSRDDTHVNPWISNIVELPVVDLITAQMLSHGGASRDWDPNEV